MKQYDVIILGTGIAGTLIATILARHDLSVLMIDKQSHPRFAIGESTVGHTSAMLQLISECYDVPEIDYLSSFSKVRKHISHACGVKRAISFVYHRQDGSQHAHETNQFVIPPHLHGLENHLFRQDIDAYYFQVAISYGAEFMLDVMVEDIVITDRDVSVSTNKSGEIKSYYVIDATGYRSIIAEKLQLRDDVAKLETNTRSIFSHMCNVKPYDECIPPNYHNRPIPWFQSTVHHVFEGGWVWVIPFNNTKNAINPLCSVGLTLDLNNFPNRKKNPEAEFYEIINRFPSIKSQFEFAKATRNWVSTGRLQYNSKATVGDRFCLLGHAAGFVDPLFSRGLAITMDTIFHLGFRVLNAFKTNHFDVKDFQFVDAVGRGGVFYHDQLVASSYRSWKDFRLWNAWLRIWALGEAGLDQLRIIKAHLEYKKKHDKIIFQQLENVEYPGLLCPDSESYSNLFNQSRQLINQAAENAIDPESASNKIYQYINEAELIAPSIGVGDPNIRNFGHNQTSNLVSFIWGKKLSNEHVRRYYDIDNVQLATLFMQNFKEFFNSDLKLSSKRI